MESIPAEVSGKSPAQGIADGDSPEVWVGRQQGRKRKSPPSRKKHGIPTVYKRVIPARTRRSFHPVSLSPPTKKKDEATPQPRKEVMISALARTASAKHRVRLLLLSSHCPERRRL